MAQVESVDAMEVASAEELRERAEALVPVVRSRSIQADTECKLPLETIQDFKDAGLIRMVQPIRFGGMAHDLEVVADTSMRIASGCGASGWLSSFMPVHNFMVGWFPEEAQEEYWAKGPNTLSATVPGYRGMAREEVPGGLKISGRTSFSSGIDHAEWAIVHTQSETCLVPREEFTIYDDWDVSGLRGTGSKGIEIKGAVVPHHRIVSNAQLFSGQTPGAELYDNAWYHVANPLMLVLNHFILAPTIGMARGVLDLFDERVRGRMDPQTLQPAAERAGPQLRYAEASAEIDTAEMWLRRNLAVVREAGETRTPLSLEDRVAIRRNIVYASKLAIQATNRLVDGMDSSALYNKNLLHRQAQDVRAGSLQFILHWEETAMQYSRVLWGLEPNTILN